MPTVRVTLPQDDLSGEQKARMVERLTETVGRFFEEEEKGDLRSYVVVHISETAAQGYGVGGEIIG